MSDPITDEEIKRLQTRVEDCDTLHSARCGECDAIMEIVRPGKYHCEACALRAEVARLTEAHRWIPVEERLPEERYAVLVWCPERMNMYAACLSAGMWKVFGAWDTNIVSHWKPLPDPPAAKDEKEGGRRMGQKAWARIPLHQPSCDPTPAKEGESE